MAALDGVVDERGSPQRRAAPAGTPILQPTDERRRTGSHYTPRSLTEPIVRHALEPAFERIGEDARPEDVLALKVCDPAMGSGAFLVEACRALAARLVQAWAKHPETRPIIPPDEDEELHARRLVAQRCLYGVDKNPMATDLARLSLWLATLAKEHEFTFLDHALKSGDSLVGLTVKQIGACRWDDDKPRFPLLQQILSSRIAEVLKARSELASAPDDVLRAIQEARHRDIEKKLVLVRHMGDAIIAAFFRGSNRREREALRRELEQPFAALDPQGLASAAKWTSWFEHQEHPFRPFHWELEFPEVFSRENGGFDAIVGNPPFAGKNTVAASHVEHYPVWLQAIHPGAHGNSDLVAHFFRSAFALLRDGGALGLIATNTIGQGDTRETGLTWLLSNGAHLYRATRRLKWPGEAAVVVSVVHVMKGGDVAPFLDGKSVRRISAYLVEGDLDVSPETLHANASKAFQGSIVLGMGFTFDNQGAGDGIGQPSALAEMHRLIEKDARNVEHIFPYNGGEEINNDPRHSHRRYVIDFGDMSESEARTWPDLMEIVERKVKPVRLEDNRESYARHWWRFAERRSNLYAAISTLDWVCTILFTAPHLAVGRVLAKQIFANSLNVFAFRSLAAVALLQSRVHEVWARFFASTLEDRLRYTPTDCFETFPFPQDFETDPALEAAGQAYHDHRAQIMIARNEGMTPTYNRFHDRTDQDADIVRLRELHAEMDAAVLRAYGWDDIAARAQPEWLGEHNEDDHKYQGRYFWPAAFRDEVLARLLALNAERAEAEKEGRA